VRPVYRDRRFATLQRSSARMAEDPNNSQQQQIPTATHNKTENKDVAIDAKKQN